VVVGGGRRGRGWWWPWVCRCRRHRIRNKKKDLWPKRWIIVVWALSRRRQAWWAMKNPSDSHFMRGRGQDVVGAENAEKPLRLVFRAREGAGGGGGGG
jgi:hypothetical protein